MRKIYMYRLTNTIMSTKRKRKFYIGLIEIIHVLIIGLYGLAVLHLLLPADYKLISAGFIILLSLVDVASGFRCPLTVVENRLVRRTGRLRKERAFISRQLENKFGLWLPDRFVNACMTIIFFFAVFMAVRVFV